MRLPAHLKILTSFQQFTIVRVALYALAVGLLGWLLGYMLASPSVNLIAPLFLMGACILFTLKRPLEGLLLALILLPFENFFYLSFNLGKGIPDISLSRAIVATTFTLILARAATGKLPNLRVTRLDVLMALSVIGLGLSSLRGSSLSADLQWVFDMYLTPYLIYFVVKNLTVDRSALERVLWAVAIIGAYSGLYGIFTQTTGNIWFIGESGLEPIMYSSSLRHMQGLLGAPHIFGLVFSLAIPIDFYLLIKARTTNQKIVCALILAVTLGGLFFTYKRTAWLATMSSFLIIQFFFPRFRRLLLALLVLVAIIIAFYGDQISGSAVVTERVNYNVDTLNGRVGLWDTALAYWQQAPILGYGRGGFFARSGLQIVESHYLSILVDAGLAGFAPFVLIFIAILTQSIRLYRARAPDIFVEPELVAVFWGALVAYLISLSTVVMNHELPHAMIFLLVGAVVGSQERFLGRQPQKPPDAFKAESAELVSRGSFRGHVELP
jgi:O-antigen ligase